MSEDVLDLIDHAIAYAGRDEMRWTPDAEPALEPRPRLYGVDDVARVFDVPVILLRRPTAEQTEALEQMAALARALEPVWELIKDAVARVVDARAALPPPGGPPERSTGPRPRSGRRGLTADLVIFDEVPLPVPPQLPRPPVVRRARSRGR